MTEFETNYLAHHGIKGQKWGIRRFQNPDGTWTDAGKNRYNDSTSRTVNAKDTTRGMSDATKNKLKKAAIATVAVAGTAAVAYVGAKHLNNIAVNSLHTQDYIRGQQWLEARDRELGDYFNYRQQAENLKQYGYKEMSDKAYSDARSAAIRASNAYNMAQEHARRADRGDYSSLEKINELRRLATRRR
jgi:hypothetical protein